MLAKSSPHQEKGVNLRTLLNFPSKKLFEILQKLGSVDSMTSETFLTISKFACHSSCAPDCAIIAVLINYAYTVQESKVFIPMTVSDCFASKATKHVCSCWANNPPISSEVDEPTE